MLLTKRGHDFPVLNSFGCLVDPFFPGEPFLLIGVFQSLDDFHVLYVDRLFRFDAEDPGRLLLSRPPLEGFIDGLATQLEILLELIAGDEEGGSDRVEAAAPLIAGQGGRVGGDAGQILDRVAILAPVETAHGDPAAGVRKLVAGRYHGLGQGVKEVGLLRVLRLGLVLRRHLTGVHGIESLLPEFGLLGGGDFKRQGLQVDLALLRFRIVAVEAIVLEKGEVFVGQSDFGFGGGCR